LRFLDISVAALIGAAAVAGIVAWSPQAGDDAARRFALRQQLRDELLGVLQSRGTVWLLQSPKATICATLQGMSNASVSLSAELGSYSCGPLAPDSVSANLTLALLPMEVILEAWSGARG
jgi:hypothetical protein